MSADSNFTELSGTLVANVPQTLNLKDRLGRGNAACLVIANDAAANTMTASVCGSTVNILAGEVRVFYGVSEWDDVVLASTAGGAFRANASTGGASVIIKPPGGPVNTSAIASGAITESKMDPRGLTVLAPAGATLTAAILLGPNICSITPAGPVTVTMDTGTNIETLFAAQGVLAVGSGFEFSIANTAAQIVTLSTAAGITLLGHANSFILNAASGSFHATRTAANTYTVVRL